CRPPRSSSSPSTRSLPPARSSSLAAGTTASGAGSATSSGVPPRSIRSMETSLKGVILAGGTGSRLHPLTQITNKHLLPVYDRPMISWAIEALVKAGVTDLMLVTGGTHAGEFFRLLGNGHEHGIDRLFYAYQERPGGIAEALGLAERFGRGGRIVVTLADNVVEGSLSPAVDNFGAQEGGARILLSHVPELEH